MKNSDSLTDNLPMNVTLFVVALFIFAIAFQRPDHVLAASESPDSLPMYVNEEINKGIEYLYNGQFELSEEIFRKMTTEFPQEPAGYFYLAMVTWSRLAEGFWSPADVDEYRRRIDQTIEVAKKSIKTDGKDSRDFFYLGGALGFKGRFELMRSKWLSSYFLASDAIEALETCLRMDPDNKDVLLGLGIFDYYTAKLSGVLKFLTNLFLYKGSREEGLRKLHLAAREARHSKTEAKSMLIHIYLFLEADSSKAMHIVEELAAKFDQNPRFEFLRGVSYIRMKRHTQYRESVQRLRDRSLAADSLKKASIWGKRALYLETVYDLFQGEHGEARSKLSAILGQPDRVNDPAMIAWPLLKIGMSYDLQGEREKALKYYQKVLDLENGSGAQFMAAKLIQDPSEKNDPFIGY
ncbi:MAG: tetratricopeptide repeat protein [Thermodesulfobacteriota bacterium]|nr:tetratricopeptide repeat protein [Thermodesulfobacteriota bacterium]